MTKEAKHFTTPLQFNQEELHKRQEKAKAQYLNGHYDHVARDFIYPSTTLHSFNNLEELVDFVAEKALEGCPRFQGYLMRQAVGYYDIRVMKPKQQKEQELQALFEQVEQDYKAEIQADHEAKKALLTEQLYQQQKTKELREQQKKEDAQRAKAAEEAEKYIQSLLKEVK